MNYEIPLPITFGMCGAFAGLIAGGCSQGFPVWVGTATGVSMGCALSVCLLLMPERPVPVQPAPVAVVQRQAEPIVIQNIYITYAAGEAKDIPVAKIVEK